MVHLSQKWVRWSCPSHRFIRAIFLHFPVIAVPAASDSSSQLCVCVCIHHVSCCLGSGTFSVTLQDETGHRLWISQAEQTGSAAAGFPLLPHCCFSLLISEAGSGSRYVEVDPSVRLKQQASVAVVKMKMWFVVGSVEGGRWCFQLLCRCCTWIKLVS